MGTYIYTLRAKTASALVDGVKTDINLALYSHKRGSLLSAQPKGFASGCDRIKRAIHNKGEWPTMVVWGEPEDGASVMAGWSKNVVELSDDKLRSLTRIGTLRCNPDTSRGAPKWIVEPFTPQTSA